MSELGAGSGGVRTIALKAAGRLIGRVQAEDPSATSGLEVDALTRPQGSDGVRTAARAARRPTPMAASRSRPSPPAS